MAASQKDRCRSAPMCKFLVFSGLFIYIFIFFTSYAFLSIFTLLCYLYCIYLYITGCLSHFENIELVLNAKSIAYFFCIGFLLRFFHNKQTSNPCTNTNTNTNTNTCMITLFFFLNFYYYFGIRSYY